MKRLVSGVKPTGELHLGNYMGALAQWVKLQHQYDAYFFVADYHALTSRPKAEDLKRQVLHTAAMYVACGIDPKSSTIFVQSDIPEHTELSWILSNFTSLGQLNRMTQFKEKSDQYGQNAGLYTYPILMAADVVLYDTEVVPVGEDQVQHLELAREIVRSVNSHVGHDVLTEPKPLMTKAARVMGLNDPTKKMSKSVAGSAIGLLDDPNTVERTIKRAVTDSDPNAATMSPALANLFNILETVSSPETIQHFHQQKKNGTLRYAELKEQLVEDVNAFLSPIQKTYQSLINEPKTLQKILDNGAAKARPIAQEKIRQIKAELGLND